MTSENEDPGGGQCGFCQPWLQIMNFGNNKEGKGRCVLQLALKLCGLMSTTGPKENMSVAFWKPSPNAELSTLMSGLMKNPTYVPICDFYGTTV